ncbi:hypothetical protein Golob_013840, partial [Gossypium lobatum]|nr:hypothetical protein [Gossypium lobatum]
WKAIGSELQKDPSAGGKSVVKKRLPKKIRQIPDCYFLPRMSTPSTLAFYGACIAGGIGAGMLLEAKLIAKCTFSFFDRGWRCGMGVWQVVFHSILRRRCRNRILASSAFHHQTTSFSSEFQMGVILVVFISESIGFF